MILISTFLVNSASLSTFGSSFTFLLRPSTSFETAARVTLPDEGAVVVVADGNGEPAFERLSKPSAPRLADLPFFALDASCSLANSFCFSTLASLNLSTLDSGTHSSHDLFHPW